MVGVVVTGGAGRAEVLGAACGGDAGVATGASVCVCPVRLEGTLHGKSQNTCSAAPSSTDGSSGSGPSIAHRRDSYLERINESILLQERIKRVEGKASVKVRTDPEVYAQV
jgi:hypothetical protein